MKFVKKFRKSVNLIIWPQRLTTSDLIQIVVLATLVLTVYLASINIRQQGEFNRYVFRPWVYVEPKNSIEIQDNRIIFWYDLRCDGESPAYHIVRYDRITFDSTFPTKVFKKGERNNVKGIKKIGLIAPGTTRQIDGNGIIDFEQQISGNTLVQNIINKILFVHIYLEYSDFKNNLYGLKCTIMPENLREFAPNQYNCEWSIINIQDECIK